jgi:alginate O-acetyltransferase complex protein AlgI
MESGHVTVAKRRDAMLFCSQAYLAFFFVLFLVYWALPWQRARVWLLLAASFYFYASWNHWLALLIGVSTFLDYWLARGMDAGHGPQLPKSQRGLYFLQTLRLSPERYRKILLGISIIGNLGLLCYFKYANFFLQSVEAALHAAGASASLPVLQVILPVGISFYTFEAINYTVDVYRRKVAAERNLANFMLFITFFPHLVAGPIVRARDFLPQTHRPKHWDWARLNLGAQYFLMGLFKKLAIADRMACFVDPIFADPAQYKTHTVWMAVLAYALQIYGDFSGYTDMAIGSAHMLGYKLAQNFNMPYLATSIAEFWRRWHISLSSWLRDYLFIPLGGSKGGRRQTCRNLLITMTLGGLWHGANWTFIIWGVVHGLLLIGHRLFRDFARARPRLDGVLHSRLGSAACLGITFMTVCCTWVLFRAVSLDQVGQIFHRLFIPAASGANSPVPAAGLVYAYLVVMLCHWVALQVWFKRVAVRLPPPVAGFGYAALLTFVLIMAPASGKAFIYFQF